MLDGVIDDFAKNYLHDDLQWARQSLVDRLDGLSEYDVRRPLTTTGTNLLGLVKHLTLSEAVYLGDVFGRPHLEPHPRFDDPGYRNRDSLWLRADESRADIVQGYRRAWRHSDATIAQLPIDATGHVPWWPQPEVKLFNVMVHVLTETNRHAGHADILREQLCEADLPPAQASEWAAHRTLIDGAARQADAGPLRLTDRDPGGLQVRHHGLQFHVSNERRPPAPQPRTVKPGSAVVLE